ncbi:hypothetical protein CDM56_003560 [Salmonella enterica subsp. diarizonae serovar 50:r:z]|nr:hypothetical protein [Salmonella enterica subsp. diarizonae serovar 50:r:z]EHW7941399.1 hypothetical protein [Salmonella enterica]
MTIYIKSAPPPTPELPDIDLLTIAGRFGGFPAGEMETIDDMNTAPVGPYEVRKGGEPAYMKGTKNIPPGAQPYGFILTVSSAGAGADGKRRITTPLHDNEFVYQIYFDTTLQLFTRSGFGKGGFSGWEKKTPMKR